MSRMSDWPALSPVHCVRNWPTANGLGHPLARTQRDCRCSTLAGRLSHRSTRLRGSSFSEQRRMNAGQRGLTADRRCGRSASPAERMRCREFPRYWTVPSQPQGFNVSALSRRCPWRWATVPAAGRRASPVQARSKAICGRCLPGRRAQGRSAARLACARSES